MPLCTFAHWEYFRVERRAKSSDKTQSRSPCHMTASNRGRRSGPLACVLKSPHPTGDKRRAGKKGYFCLMLLPPSCHFWFDDSGLPLSCLCHSIADKMTTLLVDKSEKAVWRASVDFLLDTKGFQLSHVSGCWKRLNLKLGAVNLSTGKSEGILYPPTKGGICSCGYLKQNMSGFYDLETLEQVDLLMGGKTTQNNSVHRTTLKVALGLI